MEVVGGSAGEQRFRFTHSAAWHGAHADFNRVVEGGDPGQLVELLEWGCPYHAPALLALSELAGLTNEAQRCADLLERALYSFESAWHPALAGALAAGSARMDGRAPENAPFFDALFRHAALLGRKGCVRTALEVCKLLLCLDASDPRGALCCVDYFALRAGQAPWLLRFAHRFRGDGALPSLPGFAFSLPLAAWGEAGGEAGGAAAAAADERLRAALLLHPAAAAALVQRLASVNALALDGEWAAALGAAPFAGAAAAAAASASLERLTELFVERHAPLWRPLAAQAWLKAAMLRCAEEAATPAGRAAADDWALLRVQAFPPGEPNAFAHLQPAAFSDAPPRQLPAENNPFLAANRRPAEAAGGELRLEELIAGLPPQQRQQLQRIMEEEAAARAQRDAPAAGEGPAGAGAAAAGANPLRLFLETLFRPDAAARAARPRPPPVAEGLLHEEGDSEDSFSGDEEEWDGAAQAAAGGGGAAEFEDVPQAWQEEWAEMRAAAVGEPGQEPVLDEEWDAPD